MKTIPFEAAHTYMAYIWKYSPPPPPPHLPCKYRSQKKKLDWTLGVLRNWARPHPLPRCLEPPLSRTTSRYPWGFEIAGFYCSCSVSANRLGCGCIPGFPCASRAWAHVNTVKPPRPPITHLFPRTILRVVFERVHSTVEQVYFWSRLKDKQKLLHERASDRKEGGEEWKRQIK